MSAAAGGKVGSRLVFAASGTVRCLNDAGHVTVVVEGSLDDETAAALVAAIEGESASNPDRVDLDLRRLTSFEAAGTEALARCRDLCAQVPAGLHFRTEGGPGQLALLAAFDNETFAESD